MSHLIKSVYKLSGNKVVVIIDEYDAPLLDVVHEETKLNKLRNIMRNFFSPLKDCDPYLHFVFLTGITKFSQASIFSELNNISNISMLPKYAGICGITQEEIETKMHAEVEALVNSWARLTSRLLKHFARTTTDITSPGRRQMRSIHSACSLH